MQEVYLILIILLFVLAISDLVVGVSNDAVNFLNSAIGSKVAPRKIIMIVASAGIFIGATFSSGIMEVARSGIFYPDQFLFADVMVIFLAVMLTDIILLDLFNTFGLPTSTTVSIVFELLGASFAVAFLKLLSADTGLGALSNYINSSNALTIVTSIFLSVVIAFTVGMLVQYVSRLLFSFQYKKRMKTIGIIWSSIALTAIVYFLVIKGVKGASFISKENIAWFQTNGAIISTVIFFTCCALFYILHQHAKINILKIVVLCGTFALAMAFAGNDLVNFIGVPIAGFESFKEWSASGLAPDQLYMDSLNGAVQTETYLLLIAGAVMVLTLWFSKKARSVTDTEVNLGSQGNVSEKFKPNVVGRGLVEGAMGIGRSLNYAIPKKIMLRLERRFKDDDRLKTEDAPAFDLVRASVNLTVASALIAAATSLKLPLSTTYVSFMVAMGTSLSDRAWGRDSAVYRVSGVVNVILGWFGTALIAFTIAAIFAGLIFQFGLWMVGVIAVVAFGIIIKSFTYHRSQEKKKTLAQKLLASTMAIPEEKAIEEIKKRTCENLSLVKSLFGQSLDGLTKEEKKPLKKTRKALNAFEEKNEQFKENLIQYINKIEGDGRKASELYLTIFDLEQDLQQSVELITKSAYDHVKNLHSPLRKNQVKALKLLADDMEHYLDQICETISLRNSENIEKYKNQKQNIHLRISQCLDLQIKEVRKNNGSKRNSTLFFNLILEARDIVSTTQHLITVFNSSNAVEDLLEEEIS